MNIKDIAVAAGVSTSTVSKIINRKDAGISEKTRLRVLKVIEDSNYIPYAGVREKLFAQNNLIALLIPSLSEPFYSSFADYAQYYARLQGFPLTIQSSSGTADETMILNMLSEVYFSGLLIFPHNEESIDYLCSEECNIGNAVLLDTHYSNSTFPAFTRDFSAAAELGTSYLLKHEHRRIAFIISSDTHPKIRDKMIASYKSAFTSAGLPYDEQLVVFGGNELNYSLTAIIDSGIDAIICSNSTLTGEAYRIINHKHYQIPDDISVLCLEDSYLLEQLSPAVTAVKSDVEELAKLAVDSIILKMTGHSVPPTTTSLPVYLVRRDSVLRRVNTEKKIVVAGGINMYVTVSMPKIPKIGETAIASSQSNSLGGRGANIALGVNHFGADAFMIGKLGNDLYGKQLFEWLVNKQVDVKGVSFSQDSFSGTAFINVQDDGQTIGIVNPGANTAVTPQYIDENRELFENARLCIIHMGIHIRAVERIIQICKEHGIKVILKPSSAQPLPSELLDHLFLLILNQDEAGHLSPCFSDTEAQAKDFLSRGAENVIITLGERGALYSSAGVTKKYPAADYPAIDPVGAGDVFISCLAVQLLKDYDWDKAIRLAIIAASYSVTKQGIVDNLIDPDLLEDLYHGNYSLRALMKKDPSEEHADL